MKAKVDFDLMNFQNFVTFLRDQFVPGSKDYQHMDIVCYEGSS
jgi:hypothetical protein